MTKIRCPYCLKEVEIVPFGCRSIAVCCDQVIYATHEVPQDNEVKEPTQPKNLLEAFWKTA